MAAAFTLYKVYNTNLASSSSFSTETSIGEKNSNVSYANMSIGVPETGDGPNYSYELFVRGKCTNAPLNSVTNWKMWYQYSAPETGVKLFAGSTGKAYATTPRNTQSSNLANLDFSQYGGIDDSIAVRGTVTAVNSVTGFMVFQLAVYSTAVYTAVHNPMLVHYAYSEQ